MANDRRGNCVYVRWLPEFVYEALLDEPYRIDKEIKKHQELYKLQKKIDDLAEEYVTNEEEDGDYYIHVDEKLEILHKIYENIEEGIEEIVIPIETRKFGDYSFIRDAFKSCRVAIRVEPDELIISLAKISKLEI